MPQMQRWLDAAGVEAELINGGVSGDTTAGALARVDWILSSDVKAMIVTLGGNDMLRGTDPAVSRANLAGILEIAADKDVAVLLIGMRAPLNYGPAYKEAFDTLYPDLAQEFGTLHVESFLDGLGTTDPAALRDLMQADGIHPNAAGVALIVEALGPSVTELINTLP